MKNLSNLFLIFFLSFLSSGIWTGCGTKSTENINYHPFVRTKGQQFIDTLGRELILHGLNLVNKNSEVNYLGKEDSLAFARMKNWGFNVVRLGVIWDGLEPEPGIYDSEYLEGLDKRIHWAKENGIYVLLDMHQDLFSVMFSDGAPEWATLTDGKPHITGEIWSEAYFLSPAVQTAFDKFWANTEASDGKGVQDHLIDAWKYLAARYADKSHVIGYDLLNEPFIGSGAVEVIPSIFKAYAEVLVEKDQSAPPTEEEISKMWTTETGKKEVYGDLSDTTVFARVFDSVYPIQAPFERNQLQSFYQKTRDAIRQSDPDHIIFMEHAIYSNSGVLSAVQPLTTPTGDIDEQVAYAPHGYDLVTDTEIQETSSLSRVGFIFSRIDQTADRLEMPVVVGEWGAFYGNDHQAVVSQAEYIMRIFERNQFGDTYWSYFKDLPEQPYFNAINKPYPMSVAGDLQSYAYDPDTRELNLVWTESNDLSSPTTIYIPDSKQINESNILLEPETAYDLKQIEGSQAAYLILHISGEGGNRTMKIQFDN